MDLKKSLIIENLFGNCFQNSCPVTINSMLNECSAVHLHFNALQVIQVCGAAAPTSF